MAFLSVHEFMLNPMGVDLSSFTDATNQPTETGSLQLGAILDQAQVMIERYIDPSDDFTLRFHQRCDESHGMLAANLPVFPYHAPIRGVQSFALFAWGQGGARQTWTLPTDTVEAQRLPGRNPILFGNVKVDRDLNALEVTSYAGALGFPWMGLINASASEILITYSAGYDDSDSDMYVATGTVQPSPTPTTGQFAVEPGYGAQFQVNTAVVVGAQSSTVSAVNGDIIVLATPLGAPPSVGDAVGARDGVTMPAPAWLKDDIRHVARELINWFNLTAAGAGLGQIYFGNVRWTAPKSMDVDIPQRVKDDLDARFAANTVEMA